MRVKVITPHEHEAKMVLIICTITIGAIFVFLFKNVPLADMMPVVWGEPNWGVIGLGAVPVFPLLMYIINSRLKKVSDIYFTPTGLLLEGRKNYKWFCPWEKITGLEVRFSTYSSKGVHGIWQMNLTFVTSKGQDAHIVLYGNIKLIHQILQYKRYFKKFSYDISGPKGDIPKQLQKYL